jgi:uncharacterized YigZ family protein
MYITISQPSFTHEVVIKKSRFITNMARVANEDEAQAFVETIRKEHYKATHNVFAYVLGDTDQIQRMSDDGEPSGTAGVPILEVLKKNHVHDVAVVVTRYFGGIKLGAGGLIRAYAGSPAEALALVGFVQRVPQLEVTLTIAYNQLDKLQYWLETNSYPTPELTYAADIQVVLPIDQAQLSDFQSNITNLLNGQVEITVGNEIFAEIPYHPE